MAFLYAGVNLGWSSNLDLTMHTLYPWDLSRTACGIKLITGVNLCRTFAQFCEFDFR